MESHGTEVRVQLLLMQGHAPNKNPLCSRIRVLYKATLNISSQTGKMRFVTAPVIADQSCFHELASTPVIALATTHASR